MAGPFDTERQAVEAAKAASPELDVLQLARGNRDMLLSALNAAGVELGEYDRTIVDWLAGWEPSTCAVVAGFIVRAAEPR